MGQLSLVHCEVVYKDGRKSPLNYIFDTSFILKDNPHKGRLIINAIINRYPYFQVVHGNLRISLAEYNKNKLITGFVYLIDARNELIINMLSISDLSFKDYCCIQNNLNLEKFTIEVKKP